MLKLLNVIIATLLLASVITVCYGDVGRYSNESMNTGGGARAMALGNAYTALADDVWSILWNPSGLVDIDRMQVGLMHAERFAGVVDYSAAAIAAPRPDNSVLAAGMIRLGVNGIPFTRLENPGQPHSIDNRIEVDKYVNEGEYTFFIAKAARYKQWRWGIAPKLVFRHFSWDYRAYGLGVDIGAGGRLLPGIPIEAGVTVRDLLGTVLAWEQTGYKEVIPPTFRAGLAGKVNLPQLEAKMAVSLDVSYRSDLLGYWDAAALHLGLEYIVKDMVILRAGSDDSKFTVGGGLKLKPASIDYAWVGHDDLGDTHRISVTIRWGISS